MKTQESISRKAFLMNLGLGGAAMMAILQSCTNATVSPTGPTSSAIDITNALLNVGDYVYSGNVIIARISTGNTATSFVAISKVCTHEGTTISYTGNNVFYCPNHGAQFNTSGAVTQGPANRSLTKYNVVITGNSLSFS
jgi:cytochrome b6-f complex iron-sulfur subunit